MLVDALSASGQGGELPLMMRAQGGSPSMSASVDLGGDVGLRAGLSTGGTNRRVAAVLLLAGAGVALFKYAGIRFNVGVSS